MCQFQLFCGLATGLFDMLGAILTLVVMELVGIITIQLAQDLDDVGVGIGSTESVASTIEA